MSDKGVATVLLAFCLLLCLFIPTGSADMEIELWNASCDISGADFAKGVANDSSDNIIVTGYSGALNYYTIKYDFDGNEVWNVTYDSGGNDEGNDVAVDSGDNVIVTGEGNGNYTTIKYDSSGNEVWNATYDGGNADYAYGVAVDSGDNVIVTGSSLFGGWVRYYTIKYDSSGSELWNASYTDGGADYALGVAVDSGDNVIVTGRLNDVYYTIKYDSDGNEIWNVTYDSGWQYDDIPYGIAVDSNDNVFVTGLSAHIWRTVKYDSDGNEVWDVTHDSSGANDHSYGVAVDSEDNIIVTGFDDGSYYTVAYDTDGGKLWDVRGGGNTAYGINVDSGDNVTITGIKGGNYYTIKYRQNRPPSTPTLVSPTDGNESIDTTPLFNWTTSTDANGDSLTYTLQIDNESGFSSPYVYENTTITNSNLTLATADALDDGLLYWRVRAYDAYEYSGWATYFNFTVDTTAPVITSTNVTPSSVYEDEEATISCSATDALAGMDSVWAMVRDSKDREANHTLTLISGSSYSLDYGFTGKTGTFYILYFYANDTLGNEVANSSSLSFFVKGTGGGLGAGAWSPSTPTITPWPESCNDRCRACGYISGLCRLDGCRCAEVGIGQADCLENETCCCLKSLEPCPTLTPSPEPLWGWDWLKPFKLLYEYLQRVFFYTPFMPDEINQTKQFPWNKIANKNLSSCMASMGECYIQPDDNYSIFIAYTESREEMWASKEFINITIYDIDDYPAWAKMDILIINLAAYFEVPQPEKWDVADDAYWHYLFKFVDDSNNEWWMTGVRLWWLVLLMLAVVIGVFGKERVKKKGKRRKY